MSTAWTHSDSPNGRTRGEINGKPLIGISMGDPCGIGAEVIVKALADPGVRAEGRFLIYGFDDVLSAAADDAGIRPFWFKVGYEDARRIDSGVVVVDFEKDTAGFWVRARPTAEGGQASLRFFDEAIRSARRGTIDALVTGPIHKVSWKLAGCTYPGHTGKLADELGIKRYTMAFLAGPLRVALASSHVGLFELRDQFTIGLVFQPIDLLHQALTQWFGIEQPRIAVLGLNPHAGEGGILGDEESRVIEPAMQMASTHGIEVEGPFPSDTFFLPDSRGRFDGVVAMYHDQGLIPVKMLAFDRAVNITLGLPVIRTSPDHGTAFDIAGTNQADPGSMKEAILIACRLAANAKSIPPKAQTRCPGESAVVS